MVFAQVLRTYGDCILSRLLHSDPALKLGIMRCLLRELLMVCVLRPCIMLCWPGTIYRVRVSLLVCKKCVCVCVLRPCSAVQGPSTGCMCVYVCVY